MNVKVMNTPTLQELTDNAIKARRNRAPSDKLLEALDPEGVHLVGFTLLHNDVEVRCEVLCKLTGRDDPVNVWLDMSFDEYDQLRTIEAPDDDV